MGEWQLTEENYYEAWERLKELYAREYETSRQLIQKILEIPRLEHQIGYKLQIYSITTHEVLRQLRALKYPVEAYDLWFVHILHSKLDTETSKAWELKRDTERPTIHSLLKFLDAQAKAISGAHYMEKKGTKDPNKTKPNNFERKSNVKTYSPNNSSEGKSEKNKCKLCNKDVHPLYHCDKFKELKLADRKRTIREYDLCNNCFKPFHKSKDCLGKPCLCCNEKHNSLLCGENPKNKVVASIQHKTKSNSSTKSHTKSNKQSLKQVKENE